MDQTNENMNMYDFFFYSVSHIIFMNADDMMIMYEPDITSFYSHYYQYFSGTETI